MKSKFENTNGSQFNKRVPNLSPSDSTKLKKLEANKH